MKNKVSNKKLGSLVARIALLSATANVNSTCDYHLHQPKLPKDAKKLRKF